MHDETVFWIGFILINATLYLPNYILNFSSSFFLPYISTIRTHKKIGLWTSTNLDPFRYAVELSFFLILSRITDLSYLKIPLTGFYLTLLFFNIYQYSFRRIYEYEPNFYNDAKLIKSAVAIVWRESKWNFLSFSLVLVLLVLLLHSIVGSYLSFSKSIGLTNIFYILSAFWSIPILRLIQKAGIYTDYPNDIYLRYHFVSIEIFENFKRSVVNWRISKMKIGETFFEKRQIPNFKLKEPPPNIYFIFIESYGSYFFKEKELTSMSYQIFENFKNNLYKNKWEIISNFSKSPTTAGQSWLTYSSFLFGCHISNNTYFENYLNDLHFNKSDSLLRLLKGHGYKNYNLNPTNPIKGINVPYEEMKKFYSIDNWILSETLDYHGDVYGFGECPPDQYAMNYAMEIIKKDAYEPYTFFYLTKNSHSPFISPKIVEDWPSMNHGNKRTHIHKGFLKEPRKEDYFKSICYQFDNIAAFVNSYGKGNDIFFLMGDHQPPLLSNPEAFGLNTPVHIFSKDKGFIEGFREYGFESDITKCRQFVTHEGMYSVFLREFIKNYSTSYTKLPPYEPNGLQI
jgi:hypothetical protein